MPVAQTVQPQEKAAHTGGQNLARADEAQKQAPPEAEAFLTREQAINGLLDVHAEEEARRQKCLARYRVVLLTIAPGALLLLPISAVFYYFPTQMVDKDGAMVLVKMAMVSMLLMNVLSAWSTSGWKKYRPLPNSFCSIFSDSSDKEETPLFSSQIQQNIITALLNYPDEPRIAEALCRALMYYRKDKNLLYLRLARLLPLLPADGSALSETARQTLFTIKNRTVESTTGNEKEQTLPVLQAAAREYFVRTGEPAPRPKRKWFNVTQAAPRSKKENG